MARKAKQVNLQTIYVRPDQHVFTGTLPYVFELTVPEWIAELCELLVHRGLNGVHKARFGGPEALAEFATLRIPVKLFTRHGQGDDRQHAWVRPDFELIDENAAQDGGYRVIRK